MPGCGQSANPPEHFLHTRDYADCLVAFIEALGLRQPMCLALIRERARPRTLSLVPDDSQVARSRVGLRGLGGLSPRGSCRTTQAAHAPALRWTTRSVCAGVHPDPAHRLGTG